jgi:hypothetical protein
MLEHLKLVNFQAHRKLHIAFDPRVTTIVGSSDIGKSAVLRSLRWAVLGGPSTGLATWDTKKTVVRLIVDGHTITRKRLGSTNIYTLDGHVFKAFGQSVPEPIAELLRLDEINFQDQHDPPYWFTKSAGQVSRELNSIINLSVIDSTLTKVASAVREANTTHRVSLDRLKAAKQRRASLAWVEDCQDHLALVERLSTVATSQATQRANLGQILAKATRTRQRLKKCQETLANASAVAKYGRSAMRAAKAAAALRDLLRTAAKAEALAVGLPDMTELNQIVKQRLELSNLLTDHQIKEQWLCQSQNQLRMLKKRLAKQKQCPICGTPLQ